MKTRTNMAILIALGLLVAVPAHAQRGGGPRLEDRLDRQQSAIDRGIDRGELTRDEARSLNREQREIRRLLEDLRRDGYPPREARRMVERRLERADRHIYDLTHNDERRHRRDERWEKPYGDRRDDDRDRR